MTGHASRATVDFDAFERELRHSTGESGAAKAAAKADPLAELARIVGQDDPFRALLEAREKNAAAPAAEGRPGRVEPTFLDAPAPAQDDSTAQGRTAMTSAPPSSPAGGQPASPADAFDQYLASVEQGLYAGNPNGDQAAFAEADEGYRAGPIERPRHRGRMVQVGAGLAVLAVCVGGALAWKGSHGSSSGPITVLADKTPLKVQPTATDGVEIPDQNKQIYDRNAKDGQIKIVNREEQPLDVNQAARSAASRNDGTPVAAGQGGATPGQSGTLAETFGEPRRVRTVAVKPDTPPPAQPPAQAAEVPAASPIPTMTLPDAAGGSTPAATPRRPSRTLASAAPMPVADATTPSEAEPAQPAPAPRKIPQRVAAVAPETTASTQVDPTPAPAASQASVGGFSVQLGVRGSESEARAALKQMQAKYSQLSGKPELIRQAEVNGKTIYRVRVGPLAKNEASSLCTELQGAGGQCFVAKN